MYKKAILGGLAVLISIITFAQEPPLQQYTGKYKFPEGNPVPYVDVKLVDGVLISESPMGSATLQHIEGDVFSIVEYQGVAEFLRNGDKKIVAVKVIVANFEMEGTKEDAINYGKPGWHLQTSTRFH